MSVLVPRRQYTHFWHRFLHDRTADAITQAVSTLPHCNVTIVPYHLGTRRSEPLAGPPVNGNGNGRFSKARQEKKRAAAKDLVVPNLPGGCTPIAGIEYRQRARVAGKVHTMRVQPHGGVGSLECTIVDETGSGVALVFLGRRSIQGVKVGTRLTAEGMVGEDRGRLAILNPVYELLNDHE